jgi:hypothetical protein|tara:strand:+ start:417 stop:605 length:189 start_codon:yes stop_codon:yes gene_type:complete
MLNEKDIKKNQELENNLDDFLGTKNDTEQECVGEECIINDGKEIVERVDKVYKTTDGRQLLM